MKYEWVVTEGEQTISSYNLTTRHSSLTKALLSLVRRLSGVQTFYVTCYGRQITIKKVEKEVR